MQLPRLSDITVNLIPPPEPGHPYEYEFTLVKFPKDLKLNDLKEKDIPTKYTFVTTNKTKLKEKFDLNKYCNVLDDGAYIYKVVVTCQPIKISCNL